MSLLKQKNRFSFEQLKRDILALQLLETSLEIMNSVRAYARKIGIELSDDLHIMALMAEAKRLLDDLDRSDSNVFRLKSQESSRRKVTSFRTDGEGTEPMRRFCKVFSGFLVL
jgi:hypothetical protein